MKAVGIKVLKARLSEYVRLARSGETILVTERGAVVAELRPARRQAALVDELEEVLEGLAESGEVTRASASKRGWTWNAKGLGLPAGTAATILDEIRGERFRS
jgi:prevent-host-death family protein